MKGRSQNIWVLILLLLAGVVLGGFLAQLLSGYPALSWLGYGKSFGLTSPLVLDLGVLTLQFAFTVRFTIAGILGFLFFLIPMAFLLKIPQKKGIIKCKAFSGEEKSILVFMIERG